MEKKQDYLRFNNNISSGNSKEGKANRVSANGIKKIGQ